MSIRRFVFTWVLCTTGSVIWPACTNTDISDETFAVDNGIVRILLVPDDDGFRELYFARDGRSWVLLVKSGSTERPEPALRADGMDIEIQYDEMTVLGNNADSIHIRLNAVNGNHTIMKDIYLFRDDPFVYNRIRYELQEKSISTTSYRHIHMLPKVNLTPHMHLLILFTHPSFDRIRMK
jgi:hypothetical protein